MLRLSATCWFPALFGLLLTPGSAHAYEDQSTVGLGVGYAHAVADLGPGSGVGAALVGGYGLDDIWALRARLGYGLHPDVEPVHVGLSALELVYMIDVLELVPYVGLGVDGLLSVHADESALEGGAHLVLGVDYLLSRDLLFGLEVVGIVLFSALDSDPVYATAQLTATWVFEH